MTKPLKLLFYVEQNYSFDILRPLQTEAHKRGYEVRWLLLADASAELLRPGETRVLNAREAISYSPDAVFAPGDRLPSFIPGLKVQVFHGLNEDKRGNDYPERGLFDLYCTEGPSRTEMLAPLAKERGYFAVTETGWLKLDTLFNCPTPQIPAEEHPERPQIMLASTFTPDLSGAQALLPQIGLLSKKPDWQWLITLHPKMASETVAGYQALDNENLSYYGTEHVINLMHRADVMVCDNSSVLQEFLLLKKPVVTLRNRDPQPCMINITDPNKLQQAIKQALSPTDELTRAIEAYGPSITPWLDGASAPRVLDATEKLLSDNQLSPKPANIWRNLKIRKQLGYYGF